MMKNKPIARFSPTNKTQENLRRFADQMISMAAKGRMTLQLLRDISFEIMDFTGCSVVEIAYTERGKIFHCDARINEAPAFFCETVKEDSSIHIPFKDSLKLPVDLSMFTGSFPYSYDPENTPNLVKLLNNSLKNSSEQILQLIIPVGQHICGVALLAFDTEKSLQTGDAELLEDFSRSLGLALSHNQSQFELRERVKELTCMYGIANLASKSNQKTAKLLDKIVTLLPPAWLYPEITEACILLDNVPHCTSGFTNSDFCQSSKIIVNGMIRGKVQVIYTESRPQLDEGPFLTEERHLIDSIAREVSLLLERRQAEKEQLRLHEQLKHADRLATIGQLAAGVAHELNEPLTGILGFAELLMDIDGMPQQALKDIGRIESASLHAREVVRKLLLFSRQVPTKSGPVDINRSIKDVISFLKGRLARNSITTTTELKADLPSISADAAQIRQIIVNLFVNATHAMPKGGTISVKTTQDEKFVQLEIADTGAGMTTEVKEKAFLPFFTTKDVNHGTGLGLSVVHGIINSHHGSIKLESEINHGTKFNISLPIEQPSDE